MIYLFNNQEELIKIINSPSIKVLNQTETLTDEHLLDDRITAEVNALEEDLLQEIEYMAVKKQDADYQYSLYYIISATTEGNNTELYGVTAGFEELDKTIIEDKRPRNVIPRVAIDVALENTNWTAGFVGDVPNNSSHFYYISSLEAIKKICQSWELEAEFVIEMNGSKIGARYINFYKQLGANEGKRVTYGHNALQIIQEDERTGIYTALIGRGKGELISGENENESGQAGYGRRITFEDVEWSVANGDPLNKPLGQKYLEMPDATATYGVKTPQGNRPKMGVVEFQEEENPENLLKLTYQYLVETSRPLASFKTTPAYLNAGVGDVVRVVRYDRHLDYATRVFKVVTNRLTNKKVSVQLGDQLTQSAGRQRANLANQIGAIADNRVDQILDFLPSATGKNTNFYGNEEPENPKVNDVWWKPNPEGEGKPDWIMRWTGEAWERLDVTSEAIEQQFEEIDRIQQGLIEDVEASENKAQQAIEDAGLAQVTAQTAQAEAESAKSSSSEALEKAILAVSDSETAKQNALDAVSQASTAKQNANEALGKAGEAVSKANDAIGKANQIPQDIQSEIESKGLVSGSWVESHVNDVTGEINYALSEVSGSIPTVILGVTWDKNENPILTRTDYVEEYANLTDYLLKTNEIDYSIEGLSGRMSEVETKKLDSTEFTSFKTNDYDVTVEGFRTALTDKLDEETFSSFKTNEFDVTVEGINGSIESLQTEKLDEETFSSFKSNDYELTVDGLRMDLTSVSGSIPTVIMGVEWDKSQNPELTRTDYLEYDNPNLYSPGFIMGVRWDKTENPTLYRTDDTGGVDDYEYSQQAAQFVSDISGLSGRVENVESNKLGANEFNSFKTNTYDVDLAGLRTNITSLEEGKLGSDEFSNFKTNVFDVSVSGLSGRIGTVETEKLDSETYDSFKTNTYDVDVGGLKSRMSSVETNKLDSGTFNTFRDTTYSNTIDGITGSISALQEDKLDNQDFNSFKQNEYEVTVDGLRMGLTDVQGSFPTIVLGVEWDKSSDPELTRTDFSEIDNPNLYAPSFVMGVMWDKKESPTMYRVADTGGVGDYEFTALQADYNFTKENWSTRLSQIETAGYATQSWSNQTFATPQSVSTQLQSYAKTTDLNGMVTETLLEQRNYLTASQAEQTFVQAEMLDGEFVSVLSSGTSQTAQYIQNYVIGEDFLSEVIQTSELLQSEIKQVVPVPSEAEIITLAESTQLDRADIEAMFEDGFLSQEDLDMIAELSGMTPEQVQFMVNNILNKELVQQYETVEAEVVLYERFNNKTAQNNGTHNWVDYTFDFPLEEGKSYPFSFQYPVLFNAIPFVIRTVGSSGVEGTNLHEGLYIVMVGDQLDWARGTLIPNRTVSAGATVRFKFTDNRTSFLQGMQNFTLKGPKETQVPVVGGGTGAISAKITQLYNMINLSILGEDGAMSRIAMGEEGIQIDGKLLHITARTLIDEAVIKSAMIDTLDAGKITTGELNASLIRVINLDANSISGNEASFIRAMFSGTKSTLQITGSGVNVLDNYGRSSTYLDSSGIEFSRAGINLGKLEYVTNATTSGDLYGMHGFAMRPNRNSYFAVSYFQTAGATASTRRFAVSGRTGNIYMSGLIKPDEDKPYGIELSWGTITGRGTNVRIYNHDRTGGIQINSGDVSYLTSNGKWQSLNALLY